MERQIEISSLDLRFESYRLKNRAVENKLLTSISESGIHEALQGIDVDDNLILIDGFKRYRCAKKLNIEIVPYHSLSDNEAFGIIRFMRYSNVERLNMLEEARLINELINIHKMSVSDIALHLGKSKSWVSMRNGMIEDISEKIMDKIFADKFPAYSFMHTLRPFMRINNKKIEEIEEFVDLVSGKRLSIREIGRLANGYFNGSKDLKEQIKKGNIPWSLAQMKKKKLKNDSITEEEKEMLKTLEILQQYIQKSIMKSNGGRFHSKSFFVQANILSEGILKQIEILSKTMKVFYDRTRQT